MKRFLGEGYELVGKQEKFCQADGAWTPKELPTCVRKYIFYKVLYKRSDLIFSIITMIFKLIKIYQSMVLYVYVLISQSVKEQVKNFLFANELYILILQNL